MVSGPLFEIQMYILLTSVQSHAMGPLRWCCCCSFVAGGKRRCCRRGLTISFLYLVALPWNGVEESWVNRLCLMMYSSRK